jgi:hypothetical protein
MEKVDGWRDKQRDGGMDGWMAKWREGRADGWLDGDKGILL